MAVTLEELQIKFTAEMGGLNSELKEIKQAVGGIEAPTNKAGGAMKAFAKIGGVLAAAGIGAKLVGIGKESLLMANDVTESESLFAVSMGDMADDAREWSKNLSKQLGINEYAARKNVGVLNTMFKSMGLGKKEAAGMSKNMVELAEDMASFYNLPVDEAFTKLQAGITGEAEGLKRLGILVDETTVKQYALRTGMIKQGQEMTNQQKVAARYAVIMQQTSDAQGDLARTMDSPTNQLRRLNNEFDQAKIALGQALQPALLAVLPVLTDLAVGFGDVIKSLSGADKVSGAFDDITVTIDEARKAVSESVNIGLVEIVDKINTLSTETETALNNYVATEKKTKQVAIEISLDEPTTTGKERITTALEELKALIPVTMDTEPIIAKLDAIMEDGIVTEKEEGAMAALLNRWSAKLIRGIKIDKDKQIKEINAQIKAGTITEAEGSDLKAAVETKANEAIAAVTATVGTVNAEVSAGGKSLTTVTFSPDQATKLSKLITDGITASGLVVDAAVAQVNATFEGTGIVGIAVDTLYAGLALQINTLNAELSAIANQWVNGFSPTAEDWKKVMEIRAERDRMLGIISGGLTTGGKLTGALVDLTLNSESIKNYFKAYNEAFESETNAAAQKLEAQKIILQNAFGQPEFTQILESLGLAGLTLEQGVEALNQQILDALNSGKSKAVMDAIERLGPSINEAFKSEDVKVQIQATYDLEQFLNGLDLDNLSTEAKQAILDMLNGIEIPKGEGFQNVFGGGNPLQDIIDKLAGSVNSGKVSDAGTETMAVLQEALTAGKITQSQYETIIGTENSAAALTALRDKFVSKGEYAAAGFVQSLIDKIPEVKEASANLIAAGAGGQPPSLYLSGANFAQGFIDGINDKIVAAAAAGEKVASAARAALTRTLVIESPSKVTEEIGEYFGQGFVNGIYGTTNLISRTAGNLANSAIGAMNGNAISPTLGINDDNKSIVSQAIEGVMDRLQITMNVDGEAFGRVAVRSINNNQRRAGQQLLITG